MLWMCSGHGVCLTNPGDQKLPGTAALAWLDRYVKDDTKAKLGRAVRVRRPERRPSSPPTSTRSPASTPIVADGKRHAHARSPAAAPGPAHATGNAGALGGIALPITPAKATHAVNVPITVAERGERSSARRR